MKTHAPPPFRSTPRTVCEPAGHSSYDEVMFELDLAGRVGYDDIRRWASHPDDRVGIRLAHLIEDGDIHWAAEVNRSRALRTVVETALARADAEGVVWDPVLDVLAGTSFWVNPDTEEPIHSSLVTPESRLAGLRPWLEDEATAETLDDLLLLETPLVAKNVAQHSRVLPYDVLDDLTSKLDFSGAALAMLENPLLSDVHEEWILDKTLEIVMSHGGIQDREIMDSLERRGARVTERVMDRRWRIPVMQPFHKGAVPQYDDRGWPVRKCLVRLTSVSTEHLIELADGFGRSDSRFSWYDLCVHPSANHEFFRHAVNTADERSLPTVLSCACRIPECVAEPSIRVALRASSSWEARLAVADELSPSELKSALSDAATEDEDEILDWFDAMKGWNLSETVLSAFLESPHRIVRLAAIQALGAGPTSVTREPADETRRSGPVASS